MNGNRPLLTYAECASLDKRTIAAGLSDVQLMGQAATASANRLLAERAFHDPDTRIFILCGTGNNGGDGFALAYSLAGAGLSDRLILFAAGMPRTETARFYANMAPVPPFELDQFCSAPEFTPGPSDIIIEALLGAGQKGILRDSIAGAVKKIQKTRQGRIHPQLISLDCPAGLNEEVSIPFVAAETEGDIPAPDVIHCYGTRKLAIALSPALSAHSRAICLPIGFLPEIETSVFEWTSHSPFKKGPLDHKYSAGSAWMIAGSIGMEGAALLCASSFFAAGGGIVELHACDEAARAVIVAANPTLMVRTIAESFSLRSRVLVVGPGIQIDDNRASAILLAIAKLADDAFVVLDASSSILVKDERYPTNKKIRTLITPHSGEWHRIGGPAVDCVLGFEQARNFNRELGCFSLIKGPVSVLLGPDDSFVHPHPNPALAIAGSGDCLAGMIGAALSREDASIMDSAMCSIDLLHEAVTGRIHPESRQFPEWIRDALLQPWADR